MISKFFQEYFSEGVCFINISTSLLYTYGIKAQPAIL